MVDIKTFLELRAAGYSVDEIRAYSGDNTTGQHEAQEQKAAQPQEQPPHDYQPKHAAQEPTQPQEQASAQGDSLDSIVNALVRRLQGANLGAATIPTQTRDANQILAEIINPPGRD